MRVIKKTNLRIEIDYLRWTAEDRWTGAVKLVPSALDWPLRTRRAAERFALKHGRKPLVFVNSMSDLFHEALSNDEIAAVFGVMAASPWYVYQVLTKRAERMEEWFEWISEMARVSSMHVPGHKEKTRLFTATTLFTKMPPSFGETIGPEEWPLSNVALGVSVEDQATADERIPYLLRCPARWRFVSYEPALGPVNFQQIRYRGAEGDDCLLFPLAGEFICDGRSEPLPIAGGGISQLIIGGESGPGARPFNLEWARSAIRQCAEAEVAVFFKQAGAKPFDGLEPDHNPDGADEPRWLRFRDRKGGDPSEWPADLQVQQFPEGI